MEPLSPPPPLPGLAARCNALHRSTSLYVGDLHPEVSDKDLIAKFSEFVRPTSVRLCRCRRTGKSLCYGYVNFLSHSEANRALACLNHTNLKGKSMRIMWCQRDPYPRKNGIGNLFVKNLNPFIRSADLQAIFSSYGTILSCKVAEENGKSKGFGFVQFDSEESAMAAQKALHNSTRLGKLLYVSKFVKKIERKPAPKEVKFTNVYVKNLVHDITEDTLQKVFSKFGKVRSVAIMRNGKGKSRGFGFVNFQISDDAKKAVEAMNGVELSSKTLFVGRAQKKAERIEILKKGYNETFNYHFGNLKASNLYVKNFSESMDDKKLHECFSSFGRITSAKVMLNDNGRSKGFGFVCFSTPEEAKGALNGLNGIVYEGRKLYVAIAQHKEDRCKELQNYYAQNTAVPPIYLPSSNVVTPCSPVYLNFPPYTPLYQPLYQNLAENRNAQYPLTSTNHQISGQKGGPRNWTKGNRKGATEESYSGGIGALPIQSLGEKHQTQTPMYTQPEEATKVRGTQYT